MEAGSLEITLKHGTVAMAGLKYKDFSFRPSPLGNRGKVRAIAPTREIFLKTIDTYIAKTKGKIINVESQEGFFRVWYIEE